MKKTGWWLAVLIPVVMMTQPSVRDGAARTWHETVVWIRGLQGDDTEWKIVAAERGLKRELPLFSQARTELHLQQQDLREGLEFAELQRERAEAVIEEFRVAWKRAERCDSFPIVIRDRAYTRSQAQEQVELLVGQLEQHKQAIVKIRVALEAATTQTRELAATETMAEQEMAILPLRRSLASAENLNSRTNELVHTMEQSSMGGSVSTDPVRTLQELLKAEAAGETHARQVATELLK
jgi:hypothetical protein